jgi:colicin import membrane protein
MSAALSPEPNRLPAGILALAVHGAFFSLLYFGFGWQQTLQPAAMKVELWQSLPEAVVLPPPVETRIEESVKPVQPEQVVKPDIVLPDKQKPVASPVEAAVAKPAATKPVKKKVDVEPVTQEPVEQKPVEQKAAPTIMDQQASREKSERAAELGRIVDEYKAKITAKIRRNVVILPDVPKDARAEFLVTLLPGGTVLKVELKKSSSSPSYDDAVERAILKSDPLPLPADPALFNRFRELDMVFKPTE